MLQHRRRGKRIDHRLMASPLAFYVSCQLGIFFILFVLKLELPTPVYNYAVRNSVRAKYRAPLITDAPILPLLFLARLGFLHLRQERSVCITCFFNLQSPPKCNSTTWVAQPWCVLDSRHSFATVKHCIALQPPPPPPPPTPHPRSLPTPHPHLPPPSPPKCNSFAFL